MPARVVRSYRAQYPDPISVRTGEIVQLGQRDTEFPGWIWTTASSGKSGWMPEQLLSIEGDTGVARSDYTAIEATVTEGEIVHILQELLGWAWVETSSGARGWVPQTHLARSVSVVDLPL